MFQKKQTGKLIAVLIYGLCALEINRKQTVVGNICSLTRNQMLLWMILC